MDAGILDLTTEQLAKMPKRLLLECFDHQISHVWERLPREMQEDVDFQECRRCLKHYNTGEDQNDGPPRMIKECVECQGSKESSDVAAGSRSN